MVRSPGWIANVAHVSEVLANVRKRPDPSSAYALAWPCVCQLGVAGNNFIRRRLRQDRRPPKINTLGPVLDITDKKRTYIILSNLAATLPALKVVLIARGDTCHSLNDAAGV